MLLYFKSFIVDSKSFIFHSRSFIFYSNSFGVESKSSLALGVSITLEIM